MDGISLLIDGVSQMVSPYLATPQTIKDTLLAEPPDALVFTHAHIDHYDPDFAAAYKALTNGVIIGTDGISGAIGSAEHIMVGTLKITPIASRHIGRADGSPHYSYIISGTQCVWFLGDASPLQWTQERRYPSPDVLVVPFAYATTAAAWARTKALGAKNIILVHLPDPKFDPDGLWDAVKYATNSDYADYLLIPNIGDTIYL